MFIVDSQRPTSAEPDTPEVSAEAWQLLQLVRQWRVDRGAPMPFWYLAAAVHWYWKTVYAKIDELCLTGYAHWVDDCVACGPQPRARGVKHVP
jgi:hypothetical protein